MSRLLAAQRFGLLNAKQADYVNDVLRAGEHLLALINDILDVAREAVRIDLRPESFAPGEAIRAVLSTLQPLTSEKGLSVRFEPPGPGEMTAAPARFKQVVYNLLSNAVKFTPPNGSVTIRCQWVDRPARAAAPASESAATAVRVEVTDTGGGVVPEEQERIWDEFRSPAGAGLSLAVSHRLVQRMGGDIWVHSARGEGSTFGFVLPRKPLLSGDGLSPGGA